MAHCLRAPNKVKQHLFEGMTEKAQPAVCFRAADPLLTGCRSTSLTLHSWRSHSPHTHCFSSLHVCSPPHHLSVIFYILSSSSIQACLHCVYVHYLHTEQAIIFSTGPQAPGVQKASNLSLGFTRFPGTAFSQLFAFSSFCLI